eukprot:Selendium_serpulae@DN3091_c0_g1_i2.p1
MGDKTDPAPKRVVLIRGLHPQTTAADLLEVSRTHNQGADVKLFLRPNQKQAFAEFQNETMAAAFLAQVKVGLAVRGSPIQATYSLRDHVTARQQTPEDIEGTRICLVSVSNLMYSVDLETLHGLLSKFGAVDKIVCFSKKPQVFQALVQFREISDAKTAMAYLNNRNMYDNCNTVQVLPSKFKEVTVKENDKSKSWDFTIQPSLHSTNQPPNVLGQATPLMPHPGAPQPFQMRTQPPQPQNFMQCAPPMAPPSFEAQQRPPPPTGQSPVLIVYNVPHEQVTVQMLFNLFSLYGNVTRVKMIRDKPNTALVQFSSPTFSTMAKTYLNEAEMFGSRINVLPSKHFEVKLPMRADDEGGPSKTREFLPGEQRYNKADELEKYQKSACKPTATLFVANVPDDVTKEDFDALFLGTVEIQSCSIRPTKPGSNKRIVLLKLATPEQALNAVCTFHNADIRGSNVKLAFSKMVSI